jgi:hypothetical protein
VRAFADPLGIVVVVNAGGFVVVVCIVREALDCIFILRIQLLFLSAK